MTWLEIRPQDVWLFRDGKPFSAGEDHSARSMFPPTPLTVQGALRQKISLSLGVSLSQYKKASRGESSTDEASEAVRYIGKHGDLSNVGMFRMQGPFLSLRINSGVIPLLPTPADLLVKEDEDTKIINGVVVTKPNDASPLSDFEGYQFPNVYEDFENLPNFWMTDTAFSAYLNDSTAIEPSWFVSKPDTVYSDAASAYQDQKQIVPGSLIYQSEYRFGVSTNAVTSFREEGKLYQVQFVRPLDGIGLLVSVTNDIPEDRFTGAISIGGEQRQGNASAVEDIQIPSCPMKKRFKVIFLTPAYFSGGWQPANEDWSNLFGSPVALKSAVLYRPLKIGGWNSEKGAARAMHNYVAPGSVYYFETDEPFPAPSALTQDPVGINAAALGFGQYAIGEW